MDMDPTGSGPTNPLRQPPGFPIKGGLTIAAVLLALLVAWQIKPWFTVDQNERAVVDRFGKFSSIAGPGLNFRVPIVNGVTMFPTSIQHIETAHINTYTVDNQELDAIIVVNFQLHENQLERIFAENRDFKTKLEALSLDRFKREMGKVNITQVASHRGDVAKSVKDLLAKDASELYGIAIVDFQIKDLKYTDTYRRAVDAAATAKAKVEQAEQEKRQAEVDALRKKIAAEGEANAVRETARGFADGELLKKTAEAKGLELVGLAQAKALEAQGSALKGNPSLVALETARRWSGALPVNMYGSAPVPLLNLTQPTSADGITGGPIIKAEK